MWMRLEGENERKWWFANPSAGTLPQVFKFSYSREFHKAIVSALGKILEDNGNPIEIAFNETDDQRRKTGRARATGSQGGDGSQVPGDETGSMSLAPGVFYVLPPPRLSPNFSSSRETSQGSIEPIAGEAYRSPPSQESAFTGFMGPIAERSQCPLRRGAESAV